MTAAQRIIGFTATLAIAVILFTSILFEPHRQEVTQLAYRDQAIERAVDLYVYNCLECHGASGEGTDDYPELSTEAVSGKEAIQIFQVIERGRYNTDMAAFGVDEGGNLTDMEIDSLVKLIQFEEWGMVYERTAELDLLWTLTPTETLTETLTETPTGTPTETPTTTAPLTMTPSATATITPSSGIFGVLPTESGDSAAPLFDVLPTHTEVVTPSLFDIVPTETPPGTLFDVVPTEAQSNAPVFQIQSTATP